MQNMRPKDCGAELHTKAPCNVQDTSLLPDKSIYIQSLNRCSEIATNYIILYYI